MFGNNITSCPFKIYNNNILSFPVRTSNWWDIKHIIEIYLFLYFWISLFGHCKIQWTSSPTGPLLSPQVQRWQTLFSLTVKLPYLPLSMGNQWQDNLILVRAEKLNIVHNEMSFSNRSIVPICWSSVRCQRIHIYIFFLEIVWFFDQIHFSDICW